MPASIGNSLGMKKLPGPTAWPWSFAISANVPDAPPPKLNPWPGPLRGSWKWANCCDLKVSWLIPVVSRFLATTR